MLDTFKMAFPIECDWMTVSTMIGEAKDRALEDAQARGLEPIRSRAKGFVEHRKRRVVVTFPVRVKAPELYGLPIHEGIV
jgi:hypothetical protein